MTTVLLLIHLFVTIALIGVVLIQRSEGGGLGIGTSQGMGSFMTGRGTANLLTRTTAILGAAFFVLSMTLALMNRGTAGIGRSLLAPPPPAQTLPAPTPGSPAPASNTPASSTPASNTPASTAPAVPAAPAEPAPAAPVKPAAPSVPTN
jgi:preprotein translocase subunit SecG